MSTERWARLLDELEAQVEAGEAMLVTGGDAGEAPPPFAPPSGIGALPASLAPRAEVVLARCRALEAALADRLARAPRPSAAPRFGRVAPETRARRLDLGA